MTIKDFDSSFAHINNNLLDINSSVVFVDIKNFSPAVTTCGEGSALVASYNGAAVYYNGVSITPSIGESGMLVFAVSDTSVLRSQVQVIASPSGIVYDTTSGLVDFDVKECSSIMTNVTISSGTLTNHTYRGTYRNSGSNHVFQFTLGENAATSPIMNSVILYTGGCHSIGANYTVTINDYIFVMANVDADDNVSMLLTGNFIVNSAIY